MACNSGKPWSSAQDVHLARQYIAAENKTTAFDYDKVGEAMGRTAFAIECRIKYLNANGLIEQIKNETQKETKTMSNNNIVTTKTFIGNRDASTVSIEEILTAIEQEERFIERLDKIRSSDAIDKLKAKHTANVQALLDVLDSKA